MTTFEGTSPARPATPSRDAVSGALKEYVRKHPVQAVETAGSQIVLGVRAMQYMFSDIVHRAFPGASSSIRVRSWQAALWCRRCW